MAITRIGHACMNTLVLYSTDHCSLCELALETLLGMPELRGWTLQVVDIAGDEALLRGYGARIPVLRLHGRELDAPFAHEDVAQWLGLRQHTGRSDGN